MFLIFCFEFDFFNQRCFSHKHDRIKVWWLARPFHDLNVLLFEPLLCCLGCMLWVIVVLEDSSMTHFKCPGWKKGVVTQDFMIQGPIHLSLNAVKLTCPLSRGTHPKHHASTSMLDGGDGVLGVMVRIPPPPNTANRIDTKELDFGLIWPHHFLPIILRIIQVFIGKLQIGLY